LNPASENFAKLNCFLLNLTLNHSVLVTDKGYSAASPDELALVNAAKFMGYEFLSRDNCK